MKNIQRNIALCIVGIITGIGCSAQNAIQAAKQDIWTYQNYDRALQRLVQYQPKAQDVFEKDLLIAICCCAKGDVNDAQRYFGFIQQHYRSMLRADMRSYITDAMQKCGNDGSPIRAYDADHSDLIGRASLARPGVIGSKDLARPSVKRAIKEETIEEIKVEREIPEAEYNKRLYQEISPAAAKENIKSLTAGLQLAEPVVSVTEHFMLASFSNPDQNKFDEAGLALERNLTFYAKEYALDIPEHKMTAYFLNDAGELWRMARQLHGLQLKSSNIGYSILNDLSVLGIDPYLGRGTINHEMMHILINYNCPYMQPWLAEGLPSLYENNLFNGYRVVGLSNWRLGILQAGHGKVSLKELILMSGDQFESAEADRYAHPLVKQATAKYLALYLQEKGLLDEVFRQYKDYRPIAYTPGDQAEDLNLAYVTIIEKLLNKDIDAIQADFDQWLSGLQ